MFFRLTRVSNLKGTAAPQNSSRLILWFVSVSVLLLSARIRHDFERTDGGLLENKWLDFKSTIQVVPFILGLIFCLLLQDNLSHNRQPWQVSRFLSSTILYGSIRRALAIVLWSQSLEWKRLIVKSRRVRNNNPSEEPNILHTDGETDLYTHTFGTVQLDHCANLCQWQTEISLTLPNRCNNE